jgi:alpha-ketoglutarate-dependent sulfate ester dioxygenase
LSTPHGSAPEGMRTGSIGGNQVGAFTKISTKRLGKRIGAEVTLGDRAALLDNATAREVLDALEEHSVLVFRELHFDDAAQVAFSRKLGEVVILGSHTPTPDNPHPEIFKVTLNKNENRIAEYLKGTFFWHIDGATDEIPTKATLLTARQIAESGGDTEFASTYSAYDALPDEDKERFELVRVVHSLEASQRLVRPDPSPQELKVWRARPSREHPLVWTHRSGRKSLVLGATASHVAGMDENEGRALLSRLLDWATRPDFVYRHHWRVGDLVIWDNRGALHRALPYDFDSPRLMHRTTLVGAEPIQ